MSTCSCVFVCVLNGSHGYHDSCVIFLACHFVIFSIAIVCSMIDVQFGNGGDEKERLNLSVGFGFWVERFLFLCIGHVCVHMFYSIHSKIMNSWHRFDCLAEHIQYCVSGLLLVFVLSWHVFLLCNLKCAQLAMFDQKIS